MTQSPNRVRVAIIGGGCAAMTTAFELTRPEHGGRYDVTVYQMGWRLGGKGASGRGVAQRIEEHGLHLWMGFYENAFALMRACYAELGRDPRTCPIANWQDAFEPAPHVAVMDRAPNGDWEPWVAHFPAGEGLPGDPMVGAAPFSVRGYLAQAAGLVVELLRSAHEKAGGPPVAPLGTAWPKDPAGVVDAIHTVLRYGQLATAAALFEATDLLRFMLSAMTPEPYRQGGMLVPLLDAIAAAARQHLQALVQGDSELTRIWHVVDLILAILRGATLSGLAVDPRGFDAINDYEWLSWLRMHGASEGSLRSGFVRGIYDLVFAYEDGDVERPRLAAGVALRGSMRMFFTYRGALFWRMTAGMGDIVFAPLYEVLKRRGVRFEFFHRLAQVGLGPEAPGQLPHVGTLTFDVQARPVAGEYNPLIDVHGVPCFASEPDWDALEAGEEMRREGWRFETPFETRVVGRRTLAVGEDFDLVVLGLGVAAVPATCAELVSRSPRWRRMVETARTAATQAFQIWMREDMEQLGWTGPQVNLSGYVEPFDTWADMRHLLPKEAWSGDVRSLAYFVSVLPDTMDPARIADEAYHDAQYEQVRHNAVAFLNRHIGPLWPRAVATDGTFRWEVLAAEGDAGDGTERFGSQFWMANVNPTDRYSLSVPGSVQHRLSPLDLSFDNLTVTGDWTQSGLDSGCVESAVMSGLLAAHAISEQPPLETIVGYDHP